MFRNNITRINHIFDPLEQFEVVPFINLWGLPSITNLALSFFFALCFFSFLLAGYNYKSFTNYNFLLIMLSCIQSLPLHLLFAVKQFYLRLKNISKNPLLINNFFILAILPDFWMRAIFGLYPALGFKGASYGFDYLFNKGSSSKVFQPSVDHSQAITEITQNNSFLVRSNHPNFTYNPNPNHLQIYNQTSKFPDPIDYVVDNLHPHILNTGVLNNQGPGVIHDEVVSTFNNPQNYISDVHIVAIKPLDLDFYALRDVRFLIREGVIYVASRGSELIPSDPIHNIFFLGICPAALLFLFKRIIICVFWPFFISYFLIEQIFMYFIRYVGVRKFYKKIIKNNKGRFSQLNILWKKIKKSGYGPLILKQKDPPSFKIFIIFILLN